MQYEKVHIGMKDFAPENISESQLTILLPICKNYSTLPFKLRKGCISQIE
jgi:hypothetical protein